MSFNIRTITDIRQLIKTELSSLYDAREIRSLSDIIIKTIFGADRLHLLSENEIVLTPEKLQRIRDIAAALSSGKPIQYILGETSFYNCNLLVNEHTLIPRQETEELVDMIIKENPAFTGEIIDIGTGSGCIAIALAKNIRKAHVTAIDNSAEALVTAKLNAANNAVTVSFIEADILVPGKIPCPASGIIVSNPPYVLESEKKRMHRNVLEHEPHSALFVPDNDPLVFYRAILEAAQCLLKPEGRIYFEINEAMGNKVIDLMQRYGFGNAEIIRDLNGKQRFAKGGKNGR